MRDKVILSADRAREVVSGFAARVYGWMSVGLGLTALITYFIYATGAFRVLMPYWWVWTLGTLGVGMAISSALQRLSVPAVALLFLLYAGMEGLFFGTLLPAFASAYGGQVIWTAFATAAVVFTIAMLYGHRTRADLTSLGRILSIALMGFIALTLLFFVVSFFVSLPWMVLLISYIGLILFVGLTAYDAQSIRSYAVQSEGNAILSYKLSLVMALKMYINIVMIFWYLLQIFSSSNRR